MMVGRGPGPTVSGRNFIVSRSPENFRRVRCGAAGAAGAPPRPSPLRAQSTSAWALAALCELRSRLRAQGLLRFDASISTTSAVTLVVFIPPRWTPVPQRLAPRRHFGRDPFVSPLARARLQLPVRSRASRWPPRCRRRLFRSVPPILLAASRPPRYLPSIYRAEHPRGSPVLPSNH